MKWLNEFPETMNNNDKYNLSLCAVSSFIEKNTAPGVYKLNIYILYYIACSFLELKM